MLFNNSRCNFSVASRPEWIIFFKDLFFYTVESFYWQCPNLDIIPLQNCIVWHRSDSLVVKYTMHMAYICYE